MRLSRGRFFNFLSRSILSAQPPLYSLTYWPPVTALPGLMLRALWRWLCGMTKGLVAWAVRPENRRSLTVVPFVVLGHVLLIWMLIQNRWIVMSATTVTFMPPIMASIVLTQSAADKNANSDATGPWGRQGKGRRDADMDLKPSKAISLGVPRVQRSVPWLVTELLPELRGNSADLKADQPEQIDFANATDGPVAASKPVVKPRRAGAKARPLTEPLLTIPAPPLVAVIPPPPAQNDLPFAPVPQISPSLAEARPSSQIPAIPEPVPTGPREIPPLWAPNPVPPPKLALIPPTPPVLKSIPVVSPPSAALESPLASTPLPPATPRAIPIPAPEPISAPRAIARVLPPSVPVPLSSVVAPSAAAPLPPAAPLVLMPAPGLPQSAVSQMPSPPTTVTVAPSAQVSLPVVTPMPIATANNLLPPPIGSPGAVVNSQTPTATADAVPTRNPMVVEVPRYRIADPAPGAVPGDGSSGDANNSPRDANSGGRSGLDGGGGKSGSVLGLGITAPAPLPTASAAGAAAKSLNLSLPRVEVYRSGIGPVRQPSFSDLANSQLRRGVPKDPMAEAVTSAENPDCLKDSGMGLLGAPVAAYKAMTGKCK